LPDKAFKHIPRPQAPVGTVKQGKIKVFDGDKQKMSWRQIRRGIIRDYDGDPTSVAHDRQKGTKIPTKSPHTKPMKPKSSPAESYEGPESED
jgi:hypothetical protein